MKQPTTGLITQYMYWSSDYIFVQKRIQNVCEYDMKRPEPSVAYYHYYKPFKKLIKILKEMSNSFEQFKEIRTDYLVNNTGQSKTTLEIPFIRKDSNFGNPRIVFSRHHHPKEQAEHLLERTMTYSLYEINECIAVSLAFLRGLKRYT